MSYFDSFKSTLQSAGTPWAFKEVGDVDRFEVRPGDHWRAADGTKERSEISSGQKLKFGTTYTLSYAMMIEEGQANTQDNVKIGQLHGTPDSGDSSNLGPVFAMQLNGERMRIVARSDSNATTSGRVADNFLYTDSSDLVRGHWYDFKIDFKLDPAGDGLLNVSRDGVQLVHYTGALGYNDAVGPYWKEGIYRAAGDVSLAVDFKGTSLVESTGLVGSTGSSSPPPLEPAPPVGAWKDLFYGTDGADIHTGSNLADFISGGAGNDQMKGGNGADYILGGSGDDALYGNSGDDQILGDGGSDAIYGGEGRDTLWGGLGNDKLDGDAGNDRIYGQDGNDTLGGDTGDDTLFGGVGDDSLRGGDGNDYLDGGAGANRLDGGKGADSFVFSALDTNADRIVDFQPGVDTIMLSAGAFGINDIHDLVFSNDLAPTQEGHPAIHYLQSSGRLYFDPTGASTSDQMLIAVLDNHAKVSTADFHI